MMDIITVYELFCMINYFLGVKDQEKMIIKVLQLFQNAEQILQITRNITMYDETVM